MHVIEQYFEIPLDIDEVEILKKIELAARTCYKSEDKITAESARTLVANLIKRKHDAMLEHVSITVKLVTDRAVSHELVRHRVASYAQESQRYCNYSKDKFNNELVFIKPVTKGEYFHIAWCQAMKFVEFYYFTLLERGATPEEARVVLPNSTKTELIITANLREWRHILTLRTSKEAYPQTRELMLDVLDAFKKYLPTIFSDINE